MTWANRVTVARIVAIPLFLVALRFWPRWVAIAIYILIALTDVLDGYIARRSGKSRAGAVLDPLADKLLVCAALLFLVNKGVDAWMAYAIVAREFLVTGLRSLAEQVIVASFWGKVKTLAQNVAIVWVLAGVPGEDYVMLVATILTVWSGVLYFWAARKEIREALA